MKLHRFYLSTITLAIAAAAAAGCTTSVSSPNPNPIQNECRDANTAGCVVISDKQRITTPDVPTEDQSALVNGNTAFSLDLYQQVKNKPGNLFYSPFSISMALAMTWAGARTDTEKAMAGTLHFDLSQDKLHPAFNWLDLELNSRGQGAQGADGQAFRLHVVNALWGQAGYTFEQPFIDTLGVNYGAGMRIVDYMNDPQGAADLINGWVKAETEGKIEKLVPVEVLTPETVLVLTNAIYFNAAWAYPFNESDTQDGEFSKSDGAKVTVPMMQGTKEIPYGAGAGYEAVMVPYDGNELSMLIVLPSAGTMDTFEASLDTAKLGEIVGSVSAHMVDIKMPKFKFAYELGLKETLESMGMSIAFQPGVADFTGINSKGQPFIQDVLHKAFVGVNEAGTEAAAATAVIVGDESAPEPAAITLDHPFLFLIRDNITGSVLFVGRVADPSAS
jgi:serpin B